MKIEQTPEHQVERLEVIESQFYPASLVFIDAKRQDDRDASMNKDFRLARQAAADRVNTILDQWLDLRQMIGLATPLESVQS